MFPLADTTLWMKMSDGVCLVIREEVSERKLLQRAVDTLDRATLLGLVVTVAASREHRILLFPIWKGCNTIGRF